MKNCRVVKELVIWWMAHPNSELIRRFYTAFQQGDFRTMQNCYRDDSVFSDPVFQSLSGLEVKAMWEMLVTSARDLKVEFKNVSSDDTSGECQWEAWYTFTQTGRRVHNVIDASFRFREGKIVEHTDQFDFWGWSRQALGLSGTVLGWSPFLRTKVRQMARARLTRFMVKK